jgi:hypothetical protein
MASTKHKNKTLRVADDLQMIAGIEKHLTGASLVLSGKTYTSAELVAFLQGRVDAAKATQVTRAAWLNAAASERAKALETKDFVSTLKQALLVMFGQAIDTLSDFGIAPRKRAVTDPETKVEAAKRSRATRAVRHTMGSKQKQNVKGTVVSIVTEASAAAPIPAPSAPTREGNSVTAPTPSGHGPTSPQ